MPMRGAGRKESERCQSGSHEGDVMTKLRSAVSQEEQHVVSVGPTMYRTAENQNELRCGMCGEVYFVNSETLYGVNTAVKEGLDNPFLCADCEEEYDELAYEG